MSQLLQGDLNNRLLRVLPQHDFEALRDHLEPLRYDRNLVLVEPDLPCPHAHCMESGIASQIAITPDNRRLEVGIYGRDGVGPTGLILGVDRSPSQHIIQVPGHGYRIEAAAFQAALRQSPTMQSVCLRYVQFFSVQTGYTALSNASAHIGERLARWLLMCHDRIDGDELHLTHEFLGVMLAVRRSGVTDAIHSLEGVRIIRATRGVITILDRERLEDTAGDSYGVPEAEYERLIGPLR